MAAGKQTAEWGRDHERARNRNWGIWERWAVLEGRDTDLGIPDSMNEMVTKRRSKKPVHRLL